MVWRCSCIFSRRTKKINFRKITGKLTVLNSPLRMIPLDAQIFLNQTTMKPSLLSFRNFLNIEDQANKQNDESDTFQEKLAHLPLEFHDIFRHVLKRHNTVTRSLHDLSTCTAAVTHSFELTEDSLSAHRNRRLPPKHNAIVCYELERMLDTRIVTIAFSTCSFRRYSLQKERGCSFLS